MSRELDAGPRQFHKEYLSNAEHLPELLYGQR